MRTGLGSTVPPARREASGRSRLDSLSTPATSGSRATAGSSSSTVTAGGALASVGTGSSRLVALPRRASARRDATGLVARAAYVTVAVARGASVPTTTPAGTWLLPSSSSGTGSPLSAVVPET